jgi:antitoxin (DNA-binding transcriptional repressor) of toxin-antitoxin stability system
MPKTKNLEKAEIKKSFSTVISRVSLKGEHFVIEKKGKPMAALVPVQALQ